MPNMNRIYAIYDTVAQMIVGQLLVCRHHAQAIRHFDDIARAREPNVINQHPADYDLICLGDILEDTDDALFPIEIDPKCLVILKGEQWLALNKEVTPELAPDPTN